MKKKTQLFRGQRTTYKKYTFLDFFFHGLFEMKSLTENLF